MKKLTQPRPPVPSSSRVAYYGGGGLHKGAGGAKNLWVPPGHLGSRPWTVNGLMKPVYIGTYNVRTLSSEQHVCSLLEELEGFKWDIIGLGETRRQGEKTLQLSTGHILHTVGREKAGQSGVGFLVNKELAGNIIRFTSPTDRVVSVDIKLNKRNTLKILQCYAPTSASTEEANSEFYEIVQQTIEDRPAHYTIVMGDFNAKVGSQKTGEKSVGKFGLGNRDDRGQTLAEFSESNKLRIMNTFFKRKPTKKWTWKSPNGETFNEIDYILASKTALIKNVSVINRVNIGSDHRLVRCKAVFDLKKERQKLLHKKLPEMDTEKQRTEFSILLKNSFGPLSPDASDVCVDRLNDEITKTIRTAAYKVKHRKSGQTGPFQDKTKKLMEIRRNFIASSDKDQIELSALNKTIRKLQKQDVRNRHTKLIEETVRKGTSLKRAQRKLALGRQQIPYLKDSEGNTVDDRDQLLKVAEKFYNHLFTSKVPVPPPHNC